MSLPLNPNARLGPPASASREQAKGKEQRSRLFALSSLHLRHAEDDRQLFLARRAHQIERGPMLVQRALEEEPDAADGDGGSGPRVVFDVLEIEEVMA